MPAGDLLSGDDQYEVNGLLMGSGGVSAGAVAGWQGAASKPISVPLLILEANESDARAVLATVRAAWAGAPTAVQLWRQVDGVQSYLEGRTMGCVPDMRFVGTGTVPVLCTFLALDPTEVVVP